MVLRSVLVLVVNVACVCVSVTSCTDFAAVCPSIFTDPREQSYEYLH